MSPHPNDDALSAALDGEDPAAADHAAICADCRARLQALAAAAALVATPVAPPTDEERDHAIASALVAARVTPISVGRDNRRWRVAITAAAAVVALGGLTAGIIAASRGGTSRDTAAFKAASQPTTEQAPGVRAAGDSGASATMVVADLGDVADESALRQRLSGALAERQAARVRAECRRDRDPRNPVQR
jgi:hypothetical protein